MVSRLQLKTPQQVIEMERLESINYSKGETPKLLNELTEQDLQQIKEYLKKSDSQDQNELVEMLTSVYGDKTFCIQTDWDYMFGNQTWDETHLFYANAVEAIEKDWEARKGTPHHMIDTSRISIYRLEELRRDEKQAEYIVKELLGKSSQEN